LLPVVQVSRLYEISEGENLVGVMSSNEYLTRVNLMDAANPESGHSCIPWEEK